MMLKYHRHALTTALWQRVFINTVKIWKNATDLIDCSKLDRGV